VREGPFWVSGVEPGKLAIIPRPRGGDWLEDEVRSWTRSGLDVIVSLLTPEEENELDLRGEAAHSRAVGLEFKPFPIRDRGVPSSRKEALRFFDTLMERLQTGKAVGIHCRQGIGRSALVAASLLALAGVPPNLALERISAARGRPVPETQEQRSWVENLTLLDAAANRLTAGSADAGTPPNNALPRTAHGRARRRR
jgi:protein-tyrosine phosphatase